jgi:hypothetical protein
MTRPISNTASRVWVVSRLGFCSRCSGCWRHEMCSLAEGAEALVWPFRPRGALSRVRRRTIEPLLQPEKHNGFHPRARWRRHNHVCMPKPGTPSPRLAPMHSPRPHLLPRQLAPPGRAPRNPGACSSCVDVVKDVGGAPGCTGILGAAPAPAINSGYLHTCVPAPAENVSNGCETRLSHTLN